MKIPKAFTDAGKKSLVSAPDPALDPVAVMGLEDDQPDLFEKADQAVADDAVVQTTDPKGFAERIDISWLPFAAKTYHISPNLDDYVIVNIPICPSDIPNRNGVAFPLAELIAYQPPPIARLTYKAWTGCPVHLEHDNEDHTKAIGVIFDTSLRPMKGYGNGRHYVVYGLIGIDKKKDSKTAQKFLSGEMNTGSMGALADYFTCAVCGAQATKNAMTNCAHIRSTDTVNWKIINHNGTKTVAFLNAHVLSPIEYSCVEDPAWATCLSDEILSRGTA
jgi:hypothetical protein